MVRLFLSVITAVVVFAGAIPAHAVGQRDMPKVEYGAISGNAFELFNDVSGTGVEVVAFGPESIDGDYGVVLKNLTEDPIYGVNASGRITGDDGTTLGSVSEETAAPYAIPTNGLVIQWGTVFQDDEVGDDATFDAEVDYGTRPRGDGNPRVPVPIDEISQDNGIITAHITNEYSFELSAGLGHLICLDEGGAVTHADGAVLAEDDYKFDRIPPGAEANYDFELPDGIDCDFFLIGALGLDKTTATLDAGSDRIANKPQVPSQGGTARQGSTDSGPRSTQAPAGGGSSPDGCDTSYPTVCIPTFPGYDNLNCPDVAYRDFEVLAPDPYGFDRVPKDGIGCEADSNGPPVSPTPTSGVMDTDSDGVRDHDDNCVDDFNSNQLDSDGDGIGDVCDSSNDSDLDQDGVNDDVDNCLTEPNEDQADENGDGIGDACTEVVIPAADADADGVPDSIDNCTFVVNPGQTDSDGNGIGDACDEVIIDPTIPPEPTAEPPTE